MAMTNNYGMNFRQKNRARKLREAGHPVNIIAKTMKVAEGVLRRYFNTVDNPKKEVVAEAPTVPAGHADEFGPLPGTSAWDQLAPSEKGSITKRRNAA